MNDVFKNKIIEYIGKNYNENITLVKVANDIGFNSFYLSKLIKENFEVTFVTYVTSIRIEKAKVLLQEENMNVSEIAYAVGYSEPKYFANVFKKTVGMTPSNYRKAMRD